MARLSILNDPPRLLEGPQLLHKLIPWREYADSCAFDCTSSHKRSQYTYQEVQLCVASLAARIHVALGESISQARPRRQHIVPVLLPQSPGLYISELAILSSGGAFCPINLDSPLERNKFIVSDVGASILITTSKFKDIVSWQNGPSLIIIDEFPEIEGGHDTRSYLTFEAGPDDLAYVMYTSGSTGLPKGVEVSHLAASQSLLAHERYMPNFERFLQFASPSFDVSVFEIFFPLIRGRTLVGCDKSRLMNDLPGTINSLNIDAAEFTPTVVGSLLQKRSNAPGLKLLLTIGEPLTTPIVKEFGGSEKQPNMLYGMYGPTEAAIHCTIYPQMPSTTKPGNIGIPFDTVSTFIAAPSEDAEDAAAIQLLPVGGVGELVLGGLQLARGYLNRPDQNKVAFIQFEGKKYYRTGDKARQLEDGTIEIFGRISGGQVKLRGQRIELGEVEEAVYKHPGVKTASAIVHNGTTLLVFALVTDGTVDSQEVMNTSAKWLPKYMVPNEVVLLPNFPYLPSGKVDKKNLEAEYFQKRPEEQDDFEPSNAVHKIVLNTLREILGPISRSAKLAASGLDSLVAIQVAKKLRVAGLKITTIEVIQADTFNGLVRTCEELSSTQPTPNKTKVTKSKAPLAVLNGHEKYIEYTLPCTPLQSAMLSETALDSKAYWNWVELEFQGLSHLKQVTEALPIWAQYNPILRTGFTESRDSDGFIQMIWKKFPQSQIEEVKELKYVLDESRELSLHHPVRFQISPGTTNFKLLMHIHHALYDAWSLELLLDDLDDILEDDEPQNRPSFRRIVDAYTNEILKPYDWTSKDYWKDHLADLELTKLTSFQTKRISSGLEICRYQSSIPTQEAIAAARALSVSPQSIFQAAFALVLSSYLGSSDICFGTVFSGRTLPIKGIEDIAGPCLATLPIRMDITTSDTLRNLIEQFNSTTKKHLKHSATPLRDIKSAAGVNPRQALFDTVLIWQQTLHSYDHERYHVIMVETVDSLEFSLTIEVTPTSGNIELKANYQKAVLPASQIRLFLQQLEQIVKFILSDSSRSLSTVYNGMRNDLLSIENEKCDTQLKDYTLSSTVETIATEDPDRIAIDFAYSLTGSRSDIQHVSYSQLNNRANQISHYLLKLEVLPDELVCICMEKSIDLYSSILATAKIGAGYLPLTPDVPKERLDYILREANVKVVITQSSSRKLFKSLGSFRVVYADEVDFGVTALPNISSRPSPDHVAYCVFTSGSTGTPKGVLVTHKNLLGNLDILEELYPTSKTSRFLQSCSQAFDVSAFEIFFTWRIGGCLCTATKDILFQNLEEAIRILKITHLSLTPTVAALINPDNVPTVEFLVTAGEAVTPKVFNAWADHGLWQGYGPSETTNICTVNPKVTKDDLMNNIGSSFRNTSTFVLAPGDDFSLVPRGGLGEFCFGGSQVFRGYMDQSQNVGKIIDHPKFGRLYRSGDFGRMMPDGSLIFSGRKDDRVKIRGQRVELDEINSLLLTSNKVKDCITMVILLGNDSQRLVSFWTSGLNLSTELACLAPDRAVIKALYSHLNATLPAYMIPSALVPISFIPSTAQGKIDKRALIRLFSELDVSYLDSTSEAIESSSGHNWTEFESEIAEAVASVAQLSVSEVGAETSFFNLGIDSISAISLSRALRETTGYQVLISDILKFPSVVRLAKKLLSQGLDLESPTAPDLKPPEFSFDENFRESVIKILKTSGKSVQDVLPCTPLQEAMLSAAEASVENIYENHVTFNIIGDLEKLQHCWLEMVQRHEILRTCFCSTDNLQFPFVQVILKSHDLEFGSISSLAERKPLPTNFEPPYRLDIMKVGESSKLIISMHHALYDGEALAIMYKEVEELYLEKALPPAVSFVPFLDAVVALDLNLADQFWSTVLKRCDFPKFQGFVQERNKSNVGVQIHRAQMNFPLQWIEERTKKHTTTLLAVLHTIWATIISERLEETDICFGNVVSGRTLSIPGLDRLVAPCFNTIPSRLQHIHNLTYLEAFRVLQTLNADSLHFQLTPLRRIQSKLTSDGSRLFDTLFILQQSPRSLDLSIWDIEEDSGAMDFPLVCEAVPRTSDDTLEIFLHSYSSVISEEDSRLLLRYFEEKLRVALENPRRHLLASAVKEKIHAKIEAREAATTKSLKQKVSTAAMTENEQKLRDVIADFSSVPAHQITRDVSIFRLGLDSITAVQVATRLKKQGFVVIASDILTHPTIAKLNIFLLEASHSLPKVSALNFDAFDNEYRKLICSKAGISPTVIESVRPCTAVQQGMLAQTLHSSGQEYVNSISFELLPNTSVTKLKQAWETVCREHEMFRTGFVSTEDPKHLFVMVTFRRDNFSLPWSDIATENCSLASITENLLRNPWRLTACQNGNNTMIQFTAHHALYDAQSIQMLLSDVAATYFSKPLVSRPSINSLLNAILSQSSHNIEDKKAFWGMEENKIVVNRFPNLSPLRTSETANAVRELISKTPLSELEEKCRANDVTMQAASQVAWARLLAAYIGEPSTTFGITLSGRSVHEEADSIAFPSIVTLPVKCNVSGTNANLLVKTMESNASLHRHQFTPLTSIQKWSGYPEGNLFDTLFAYQKFPSKDDETSLLWKISGEEASVDYAISLEVQPSNTKNLVLRLSFRKDMIPLEHAELILQQYDLLLSDTLENPNGAADGVPTGLSDGLLSITPAQKKELVGPVTLLHEFVERGARRHPNKTALEFATCLEPGKFQSRSWSYAQLNQDANRIVHMLQKHGVLSGEIIAICFNKCAEASLAIVGILKTGCAYVALDPKAGSDRLKFILQDSGAKLILTAGTARSKAEEAMPGNVISLDNPEILANYPSKRPTVTPGIGPQDISYCLYTSGTTGTPKGCLITHENAVQFMLAFTKLFEGHWTEDSKYMQFASFHFDVSVMEQFWSWCVGITVASAPQDLIFEDLAGAIRQLKISHIDLTPSLARTIHPSDVPSLCKGAFVTGGEALKQEILDDWGEHAVIYNGYGPTEVTIGCTMYPRVPKNGRPDNIGLAYINVGSYVLKLGTEEPVLRGAVGELCVSGKLLGKGYLNRPDLTAERFPTLKFFQERVYRTGDLVRILHDGSFIFIGRADDQVKLRGQRLELSEINEVIKRSTEAIQEVVTQVLKHKAQQKEQLVTFFVAKSEENQNLVSSMRDACKSKLPVYMVPTHFIPIHTIPLNANNKVDKKRLAAMYDELNIEDLQKFSRSNQQQRSWNGKEMKMLENVAKAIGAESSSLSPETTIFELGLDSISMIGFSRALQNTGLEHAKLSIIKSNPSIGGLINALLTKSASGMNRENAYMVASQKSTAFSQRHIVAICKELEIDNSEIERVSPCTPVQEGMIYRFLENEHPLYFNAFQFQIHNEVNQARLLAALNRLVSHIEVLRTKFVTTDDGFAQVVLKHREFSWDIVHTDYEQIEKIAALKTPYSISLKANILSLTIFHGLYDGISLTILLHRIVEEYQGLQNLDYGPPFTSALPFGPLAEIPGAKNFWTEHLKNWLPTSIPTDLESTNDVATTSVVNNPPRFEALRRKLGVTPQAMIQAAWLSALQDFASPNLTLGIITSGRTIDFEDADKIIGPLFNTVPFHIKIESGMSSATLIATCHEFNMKMQDFQHTPLKDIQKWSPAKSGQSLFETLFVFQKPAFDDENFARDIWIPIEDKQIADYPLAFEANLSHDNKKLSMTIVAKGSVLSQSGALELLDKVQQSLSVIIDTSGTNTVREHEVSANGHLAGGQKKEHGNYEKVSQSSNGYFVWTEQANDIRMEIATLAKIGEKSINETSSIFELGLDSIDVIKLSSRLKRRRIQLPVSVIIRCQTIEQMLAKVEVQVNGAEIPTISINQLSQDLTKYLKVSQKLPESVEIVLPATPLQQTMINEMAKSRFKRYFNVDGFKIHEDIDLLKLMRAVKAVIEMSSILRASFVEVDDPKLPVRFAQIIYKKALSENYILPPETLVQGNTIESIVEQFRIVSADLAAKSQRLLHVRCVTIAKSNYLLIAISHALYDGISLQSIHDDIRRAYYNELSPRPDFLPFLEQVFQSTTNDAKSFWKTTFSNVPTISFPRKKQSEVADMNGVTRLEKRSRVPLDLVEYFCKSSKITLQTLGQTCWALVLSHLTEQLDVIFGSVLSCRNSEEASEVVFPLMNTVAVRSVLHGTLSEMLKYMQELSDATRQYEHFPLGTVQAYALASRQGQDTRRDTNLFDTLFIYQGRRFISKSKQLYESVYGASDVEFPVCVEMEVINEKEIQWTTACKSIARNPAETEALLEAMETTLEQILSRPNSQTLVSDKDGISVCGLPKFKPKATHYTQALSQAKIGVDENWSETELKIRKALYEISGVPENEIQKETTIFHLGLDSILVLKLPALFKTYGIKLSVSNILKEQTVLAMARSAKLSEGKTSEALNTEAILQKATLSDRLSAEVGSLEKEFGEIQYFMPATAGQMYMFRYWQATKGAMFFPTFTYAVSKPLKKHRLESAWQSLLARHEILRTGFVEARNQLFQVVYKNSRNEILNRCKNDHTQTRMWNEDLRQPPLNLVVEVYKTKTVIKLIIHHVLYDGISLPILVDELQSLYQEQECKASILEFKTFVAHSISVVPLSVTEEKWKSYLTGLKQDTTSTENGDFSLHSKKRTEVFHPATRISNVKRLAQEIGVSVDALLLAHTGRHVARGIQQAKYPAEEIIIGVYLANRAPFGEDISALAAPTLNILPLRIRGPLRRPAHEVARDIQIDLQLISSADMVFASLANIYEWTGLRVNCFVNILKSSGVVDGAENSPSENQWEAVQDLRRRAEVVDLVHNDKVVVPVDGRGDAYLPPMDIELRYNGETIDVGIFAPSHLLSIALAENLIKEFTTSLT